MKRYTTTPDAYNLLHRGAIALSAVEEAGVRVDTAYLDKTLEDTKIQIRELEDQLRADKVFRVWQRRYGQKTKLGSREQLATVLFKEMGYESKGVTETGRDKADESAFEHIDLPFVKNYIRAEKLKKAKSTYLEGIRSEVTTDGYIHPSYNLNTARTYRSSCNNPNFMNIPVRDKFLSGLIRRCYIPKDGNHFVEVDFSGIEVRVAACYHHDPVMIKYLNDPTSDMHRDMASQVYMLEKSQVSKNARYAAKNMFVFPQFYGSIYSNCATQLWEALDRLALTVVNPEGSGAGEVTVRDHLKSKGIKKLGACDPNEDAEKGTFEHHLKKVEEDFWGRRFKVYAQWKKDWFKKYQEAGGFMMKTGFAVNGAFKRNDVINYPVQGSAFHCLLWCIIQIQKWITKYKMKTRVIGQVHDSIVSDVPPNELQDYLSKLYHLMTVELPKHWSWITVPLDTEAEVSPLGLSWFDKQQWVSKGGLWALKV